MKIIDKENWSIEITNDGEKCISCWQASWLERLKFLIYGKAWIYILSGITQPPVAIVIDKTVFPKGNK